MSAVPAISAAAARRRRFGLDTVLPADPARVEADVLRLLAAALPDVVAVRPSAMPDRPAPAGHRAPPAMLRGAPDLLLLSPGGRSACLSFRAQADRPTRDERAFEALCQQRNIPFAAVRSTGEARHALQRFGFLPPENRRS